MSFYSKLHCNAVRTPHNFRPGYRASAVVIRDVLAEPLAEDLSAAADNEILKSLIS
jgi:hypothetical protein